MTGSLPYYYGEGGGSNVNSMYGLKHSALYGGENGVGSMDSSGYPTPRPGSAASGFDMASFYMGSPQIGGSHASNLFRSFPRPHSSPKMKLRLIRCYQILASIKIPECNLVSQCMKLFCTLPYFKSLSHHHL